MAVMAACYVAGFMLGYLLLTPARRKMRREHERKMAEIRDEHERVMAEIRSRGARR